MSRWANKNSEKPETSGKKVEIEGLVASCELCKEQTDTTWYLPEIKALSWKCSCGYLNILTDFKLPQ